MLHTAVMASALPAINHGGSLLAQSPVMKQGSSKPGSAQIKLGTIEINRSQTKRERENTQRRIRLRKEQADLTKTQTAR